jgi:hypothetical protein
MPEFRITTTQHVTYVYEVDAETSAEAFSAWSNKLTRADAVDSFTDQEKWQETEEIDPEEGGK